MARARSRRGRLPLTAGLVALLAFALAACGVDREQLAVCERLISAFDGDASSVEVTRTAAHPTDANAIIVDYRVHDHEGGWQEHWLSCHFRASVFGSGRLELDRVANDRWGEVGGVRLAMLRVWLKLETSGMPPPTSYQE